MRFCRTDAQFSSFIKASYFPRISDTDLATLLEYYPSNITQGSPFDTGNANALSPQYKRYSALLGDLIFQVPRRLMQQYSAAKQPTWMFRTSTAPISASFSLTPIVQRSLQTLQVPGRPRLVPRHGRHRHLRRDGPDGLPRPLRQPPRPERRGCPCMAAVLLGLEEIDDAPGREYPADAWSGRLPCQGHGPVEQGAV